MSDRVADTHGRSIRKGKDLANVVGRDPVECGYDLRFAVVHAGSAQRQSRTLARHPVGEMRIPHCDSDVELRSGVPAATAVVSAVGFSTGHLLLDPWIVNFA